MNQQEILSKLGDLKGNLQQLLSKVGRTEKVDDAKTGADIDLASEGVDNYVEDLPLTINREAGPGVKFYTTENSEASYGMEREKPTGIDSFDDIDLH